MLRGLFLAQVLLHFLTNGIQGGFSSSLDFIHCHDVKSERGLYRFTALSGLHGKYYIIDLRFHCALCEEAEFAELNSVFMPSRMIYHYIFPILALPDPFIQLAGFRLHLVYDFLRRLFRQLDQDLFYLAGFLYFIILPVFIKPGFKLPIFQVHLFRYPGEGQNQVGEPDSFRFHEAAFMVVIGLNLLVCRLYGLLQFIGGQHGIRQVAGLVQDARITGHLRLRDKFRCKHRVAQLFDRHIPFYPGQKSGRRQAALTCRHFKHCHIEPVIVIERGNLPDQSPRFLVTYVQPGFLPCLHQQLDLYQVFGHPLFYQGFRTLHDRRARDGLPLRARILVGALEIRQCYFLAIDLDGNYPAALFKIIVDAPERERNDHDGEDNNGQPALHLVPDHL